MRKIATFTGGPGTVKVYWNAESEEYVCKLDHNPEADYHTDERDDAIGTAKLMAGLQTMRNPTPNAPHLRWDAKIKLDVAEIVRHVDIVKADIEGGCTDGLTLRHATAVVLAIINWQSQHRHDVLLRRHGPNETAESYPLPTMVSEEAYKVDVTAA